MSRSMLRVRPGARAAVVAVCAVLAVASTASAAVPATRALAVRPTAAFSLSSDISGTVTDSASGSALSSAEVAVSRGGQLVENTSTDDFGRYTIHNLAAGTYTVVAHFIGFGPQSRQVTVGSDGADIRLDFRLVPVPVTLSAVQVTSSAALAVNTRTGDQTFKQDDYHGAPTQTTSQILQQSVAGAARAPTGEVHIRGQHAEYTYYVDGVPIPPGISGSLNELFDPQVVNEIDFQTGGWDAEYGNKNAAIVNVTTKIPAGGFHMGASAYGGSFNSDGGSASLSTNSGRLGVFLSGAYQSSNMRLEPVVGSPVTNDPINFHNHGTDAFGFGKLEFRGSPNDVVDLDLNWSQTHFQVPYDTTGGAFLNDHQIDGNGFANLSWHHLFSPAADTARSGAPTELFSALFYRAGGLKYVPGAGDDPQFIFFPDPTPYNLRENRNFNTIGVKEDLTVTPRHELEFKTGILAQFTSGHEDFSAFDASGNSGPQSNSGLSGNDIGVYAQTAYAPVEQFQIRAGLRYDSHQAPFAGVTSQLSPRLRLNFYPTPTTTLYAYYGRQFMPTNVEDLRAITSVAQNGVVAQPTLPERDNFYEAGLVHRFAAAGLVTKFAGYYKDSKPGNDDNTVPGSAITTTVNIAEVRVTGVEGVVEFHPDGPLSGYVNAALNHAYGHGPVTGGFFPTDNPTGYFDLDHDQRLSIVGSATYGVSRFYASATEIYGSGLTNGVDPSDCGCSYGTGLFDFNSGIKVAPSAITNVSLGYTFVSGGTVIRPELYVDNLFDKHYILKGAFFSGASYGRPRSIQLRVHVGA
jgi:TonB dependent receptor-like, beta-barrel/Carboxypeptidase regulatory-like domain